MKVKKKVASFDKENDFSGKSWQGCILQTVPWIYLVFIHKSAFFGEPKMNEIHPWASVLGYNALRCQFASNLVFKSFGGNTRPLVCTVDL